MRIPAMLLLASASLTGQSIILKAQRLFDGESNALQYHTTFGDFGEESSYPSRVGRHSVSLVQLNVLLPRRLGDRAT